MNQFRKVHRITALLTFLAAFALYYLTCYPSVTFGESAELAAAAVLGQVPSAVGVQLWVMMGGALAQILPGDPAHILILFSALCSALAAMVVCLIVIDLYPSQEAVRDTGADSADSASGDGGEEEMLTEQKPEPFALPRSGRMEGPALAGMIGGLAFAGFDAVWSTATQVNYRSAGFLVVALVLWAGLRWYRANRSGESGSLRWLLLAGYTGGLALGVDPYALAVLALPVLLVWMRFSEQRFGPEWTVPAFLAGAAVVLALPFLLVEVLPGLHLLGIGLTDMVFLLHPALMLIPFALLAVWFLFRPHSGFLAAGLLCVLVLTGYTTFAGNLFRSEAHPVMDHHALNSASFFSAGSTKEATLLADSIESTYHEFRAAAGLYPHAFLRNVAGRENSAMDSPVAWFFSDEKGPSDSGDVWPVRYFALPLLLAMLGLIFHYRYDWKTAFAVTVLFALTGPVASMVAGDVLSMEGVDSLIGLSLVPVAIWIGLGAAGLAESARVWGRTASGAGDGDGEERGTNLANGVLVLCLAAAPVNLLYNGYAAHDHSGDYVAQDYAYNLLQSTEPNAVLMVEWSEAGLIHYLQDVLGVRRDVRAVNLARLESGEYLSQLEHESAWDAAPVLLQQRRTEKFSFLLGYQAQLDTISVMASESDGAVETPDDPLRSNRLTVPAPFDWGWRGIQVDSASYLRTVRHQVIADIVSSQILKDRPLYFSMNVHPRDWVGLDGLFRWESLAFRISAGADSLATVSGFSEFPLNRWAALESLIDALPDDQYSPEPNRSFLLSRLRDPSVNGSADERRVPELYRRLYLALAADALINRSESRECVAVLNRMDAVLPLDRFPVTYWVSGAIASLYGRAGDTAGAAAYANATLRGIRALGDNWKNTAMARRHNPYQTGARMHVLLGDYGAAINSYQAAADNWERDPVLRGLVEELRVEQHLVQRDTAAAIGELRTIIGGYGASGEPGLQANRNAWEQMLQELEDGR